MFNDKLRINAGLNGSLKNILMVQMVVDIKQMFMQERFNLILQILLEMKMEIGKRDLLMII